MGHNTGEGISTHAAPGDAMVFVLERQAEITIDGKGNAVSSGGALILTP